MELRWAPSALLLGRKALPFSAPEPRFVLQGGELHSKSVHSRSAHYRYGLFLTVWPGGGSLGCRPLVSSHLLAPLPPTRLRLTLMAVDV